LTPLEVPQPLMELPPGESHTWTVTFEDDDLGRVAFRSSGTSDVTVGAVGGGTYAFAAEGWWDDQAATPTYEHRTVFAAQFELTGEALQLVPSDAVTDTRRDGDRVVVEADNPDGGDPATYALTQDEDATDPREFVTEQVYRQWPLRDALAHAGEDVQEVYVETTTPVSPPFGVRTDEDPAVRYDGRTYRVDVAVPGGQ